jgi:hypothetical protein
VSKSIANSDSHKAALADQRKRLKIKLWMEREPGLVVPPCDYCDEPIRYPDDSVLHEWLIKRSALPVALQVKVMHEYNCVLSHDDCHAKHGQTREFKLRCARAQYKRYGREAIVAWVKSLGLKQKVEIPKGEEANASSP